MALRATCLLLCALLLAGCASSALPPQAPEDAPPPTASGTAPATASSSPPTAEASATPSRVISVALPNGLLTLDVPRGWKAFATDDGVVLAEHMGGLASIHTAESGLLAYVFASPIAEALPGGPSSDNPALDVLRYMRAQPQVMRHALVSEAQPFMWGMYPAAYYTLNSGTGDLTLLVAAAVSDSTLVVVNLTLPQAQADRIDSLLPVVLARIQLGDAHLDGASLRTLPQTLVFPSEATPSTVASDATRPSP